MFISVSGKSGHIDISVNLDAYLQISYCQEEEKDYINTPKPKSYHIAPWHYIDNHLVRGEDGNWKTRTMSRCCDKDGAYHDFCPPNASLETYVNTKIPKNGFAWGDLITHFLVG